MGRSRHWKRQYFLLGLMHFFGEELTMVLVKSWSYISQKYAVKSQSFDQPFAKIRLRIPGQGCE